MRTGFLAIGFIIAGLLTVVVLVDREAPLSTVGPSVEQICVETMQHSAPDLSWVAERGEDKTRRRGIKAVTLGELPSHDGNVIRVAGVLHAKFEWVALYPSRAAMEEPSWPAPWVSLGSLWPDSHIGKQRDHQFRTDASW
jgi:hypothetical protein